MANRSVTGDPRPNAARRRLYRARFFEAQDGACAWCKAPLTGPEDGELDRIVPGIDGGRYNLANLVLSCIGCNQEHGRQCKARIHQPRALTS